MNFKLNNSGQIGQVFAGETINVGKPGTASQTVASSASASQPATQRDIKTTLASPSHACLRRLLNEILPTDTGFSAFCHDHFPEIYAQFGTSMEREQKNTLLLQYAQRCRIYQVLQRMYPGPIAQRSAWIELTDSE